MYDFLVLDAMNHAHRSWWGCREAATAGGVSNGLEKGFLTRLLDLRRLCPGAQMVIAWDGVPLRQWAENPMYKAGRETRRPQGWHDRCARLRDTLGHVFPTLHDPEDEADVEIARFLQAQAGRSLIVSTDTDLGQLLTPQVDQYRPGPGGGLYRLEDFVRDNGFPPSGLVLFRALKGGHSDGLNGLACFPTEVSRRLAAEFLTVKALYGALGANPFPEPLACLTRSQLRKLRNGAAQVRSNARVLDLLAAPAEPHLTKPRHDWRPLRELLAPLQLQSLGRQLEADLAVGWGPASRGRVVAWAGSSVLPAPA
jgi:hypothetical protein